MVETVASWPLRLRRALRSRYVLLLEAEVTDARGEAARLSSEIERLRLENRALINSLLGTAGIPPIETLTTQTPAVLPIRRRSWPQISTAREIEAERQARVHEREQRQATPRS